MKNTIALLTLMLCVTLSFAQKKDTYVIVHGAWGGSWAFGKVDSMMTAQGNVVFRPSLTGQGERVHLASPNVDLSTHINDVVNTILFENLRNVILVGHSYGGMVVTGVVDRIPDRIKRVIYLDAFVPVDGESVLTIASDVSWLKPMMKDGFLVPSWVKADQKPPKDVPQSLKTFEEKISLKNTAASKVAATYILTVDPGKKPEDDTFFSSYQRAKQRGWSNYTMTADHNPQWSAPSALVEILERDR